MRDRVIEERRSTRLRFFQLATIPGLLQTRSTQFGKPSGAMRGHNKSRWTSSGELRRKMDLTDATWHKSTRSGSNGGECVEITVVEAERPWI